MTEKIGFFLYKCSACEHILVVAYLFEELCSKSHYIDEVHYHILEQKTNMLKKNNFFKMPTICVCIKFYVCQFL